MRDVVCWSLWHKSRACKCDHNQCDRNCEQCSDGSSFTMRGLNRRPRYERVIRRNPQGEAENSRDRSQLREREISCSRIAKQIPWKSDVRKMQEEDFGGNPQEWRGQARWRRAKSPQPRN